jgi:hypothetical protein
MVSGYMMLRFVFARDQTERLSGDSFALPRDVRRSAEPMDRKITLPEKIIKIAKCEAGRKGDSGDPRPRWRTTRHGSAHARRSLLSEGRLARQAGITGLTMRFVPQGTPAWCDKCLLSACGQLDLLAALGRARRTSIIESLARPEIWDASTSGLVDGKKIDPTRCDVVAKMWSLNAEELLTVAQRKLDGFNVEAVRSEEEYRRQEYLALLAPRGGPETDLFVELLGANELGEHLGRYFSSVALVKKLRETRALAGF